MRRVAGAVGAIVGLLLVAGCGAGVDAGSASRAGFEEYFERYEAAARQYGAAKPTDDAISIVFGELEGDQLAVCERGLFQARRVVVNEDRWPTASDASRELVIMHELGHCLRDRSHDDGILPNDIDLPGGRRGMRGFPRSLMYSKALPGPTYQAFRDYYLQELFTH